MMAILLGVVLMTSGSERIRCALDLFCNTTTTVVPLEESVATTTISVTATTTVKETPVAPRSVPATPIVPAPPIAPPPTVTAPVVVVEEGPTTFSVSAVPLLSGGDVERGDSVPLSYLQIVNRGSYAARLEGFWIKQNGNAPTRTVIGLSTVDDKGGSRGQTGGTEGSTPFSNGVAFAPTDALFQPGQMRLFTIMATMSSDISTYVGTELKIDVTSLQAEEVTFTGSFPIRGTTWTLSQ